MRNPDGERYSVQLIVPNPYFPTITERRQNNLTLGDLHASSNKSETDLSPSSISIGERARGLNGAADLGFGIRRRHRCFVVTARARSFLYHQVAAFSHVIAVHRLFILSGFLNSLL
jgi:tRNA pseudouridine38-40 synthase